MKGFRKCFGVLLLCSITLGASFVGYSDTNAIDYSVNIRLVDNLASGGYKCQYRWSYNESLTEVPSTCRIPGSNTVTDLSSTRFVDYFKTNNTFDIDKDKYYLVKFFTRIDANTTYPLPLIYNTAPSPSTGAVFDVINVDVAFVGDGTMSQNRSFSDDYFSVDLYPYQIIEFDFLLKPQRSGNYPIEVSKPGSHLFTFVPDTRYANTEYPPIYIGFYPRIEVYDTSSPEESMNEKDDEDRDNLESQSSETDSASESSSSDAESTGTTLLGAFSAFVTAITSASPSNCNLDMDLGNLDLGVVNLCSLSPPQPIPTIASIFMILFCVPLSISTARKVINLFRSFQ